MMVRREITKSDETSAWNIEEVHAYLKQYVEAVKGELACQLHDTRDQVCCSGESAITAEALVNDAR